MVDFAFEVVGVHRLEARAAVKNGRGNGALRKIGAVQEGLLRKSFLKDGEYLDQALWTILDEDWTARTIWTAAERADHSLITTLPTEQGIQGRTAERPLLPFVFSGARRSCRAFPACYDAAMASASIVAAARWFAVRAWLAVLVARGRAPTRKSHAWRSRAAPISGCSDYEKIVGTIHFAVDPKDPQNRVRRRSRQGAGQRGGTRRVLVRSLHPAGRRRRAATAPPWSTSSTAATRWC